MTIKKILPLFLLSSGLAANELDTLIDASGAISSQLTKATLMVGAATMYAHEGSGLSSGSLSQQAHISTEQLDAYNNALQGMSNFKPYGDVQTALEEAAYQEIELLDQAVTVFTEVATELMVAVEVNDMAVEAASPVEKEQVQTYVAANDLTISQESIETYNDSLDQVEEHANTASAYLAVSQNKEAVQFLSQGAEKNNSNADLASISYNANRQWVRMSWSGTNNATAVYLNGQNFGIDLYLTDAEVLAAGSESDYYNSSLVAKGFDCYVNQTECEI